MPNHNDSTGSPSDNVLIFPSPAWQAADENTRAIMEFCIKGAKPAPLGDHDREGMMPTVGIGDTQAIRAEPATAMSLLDQSQRVYLTNEIRGVHSSHKIPYDLYSYDYALELNDETWVAIQSFVTWAEEHLPSFHELSGADRFLKHLSVSRDGARLFDRLRTLNVWLFIARYWGLHTFEEVVGEPKLVEVQRLHLFFSDREEDGKANSLTVKVPGGDSPKPDSFWKQFSPDPREDEGECFDA